jgi:GT2 family glycosyltransferase
MRDSITLSSLLKQDLPSDDVRVVIWDNSPESVSDEKIIDDLNQRFKSVEFIHSPENTSLSVIYNSMIRNNTAALYVFLDQDSELSPTYIRSVIEAAAENPKISLFAPQVRAQNLLVSPGSFKTFKGKLFESISPGIQPSQGMTIVTSGMTVRPSLFKKTGLWFNEKLWLYAIDTDFFLRFRDKFPDFYVLDEIVGHGSALRESLTVDQRLFRFGNLRWSYLEMFSARRSSMALPLLYMGYLSIKHAIQYRSLRFLRGWSEDGRRR